MTQISRRSLPKDIETKIYELFWQSFIECRNKQTIASFLDDLLTPTEKVMLAKRISIAFLLLKDYDYRSISSILKVSIPTVWRVNSWLRYKGGCVQKILDQLLSNEKWNVFLSDLDVKIREILFPVPGKGMNWKEVKKQEYLSRKKSRPAF